MALAHNNNYLENEQPAPRNQEWDALRNELETLLEQVDRHQQTQPPFSQSAPADNSYAANPPPPVSPRLDRVLFNERRQPTDRRQQALTSVQQAIERFDKPDEASPMPTHTHNQLQTAIDQIRASQNRFAGRPKARGGHGLRAHAPANPASPASLASTGLPSGRINNSQLDQLSADLANISARFSHLENAIGAQHNSAQALEDMASQVEQLSSVVELLANSVGERSHIKRLETQISQLADAVASGSELDFYSIDERLGILTSAFESLSQLHSEQLQAMERADDAKHIEGMHLEAIQTGVSSISGRLENMDMGAIEASVRAIYDRIDALEANMAVPLPAIERLSRELADFSKALRNEKGPAVSSSLVNRVDALNQRISQIEDSGQPVEALKIDMKELHEAVVGAMEPRFAALEDKIGAISEQFASNSGNDLPDISVEGLEKQVRLLADKMDQTSSELNGLQRLYSDNETPEPAPDIGAMAELVAKRTSEAVQKVQEQQNLAVTPDAMEQLETRLSSLFDKSNIKGDQKGFSRVQDSIEQVNQRLERLEISLRNADLSAEDTELAPEPTPEQNSAAAISLPDDASQPGHYLANEDALATKEAQFADQGSSPPQEQRAFENRQQEDEPAPRHLTGEADDAMPKAPSDEGPLNSPPYPAPFAGDVRVPIPRHLRADPEISDSNEPNNVEFAQPGREPVETSDKVGTGRIKLPQFDQKNVILPPAPASSFASEDSAGGDAGGDEQELKPGKPERISRQETSREQISRSTFIEAARRAAQKHNPEPEEKAEQSLIGRALARFQKNRSGDKSAGQEKAPKQENPHWQSKSHLRDKLWRQKPHQPKPAQDALSKKEHLEELANNGDEAEEKSLPDEFDINDISVRDTSGEQSFLIKHRRVILLVAALLTISLLTINLIKQRSGETLAPASAILSAPEAGAPKAILPGEASATPSAQLSNGQADTTPPEITPPEVTPSSGQPGEQSSGQADGKTEANTGLITGSIDGFSAQPGANIRIVDPTASAQMPPRLDLASVSSSQTSAVPPTIELAPTAIGPIALRQAAARGDKRAQFEVAAIYAEGKAIAQDLKAAARWYQRAASQGFAPAAYRLGNMYENGVGVDKNIKQAALWYKLGAEAGNRMAMHNLASLLASGALGKQRFDEAALWFEKAAGLGLKDSQFNLGMLYARGLGVGQDMQTSFKWFSIAASQGDDGAKKAAEDIARSLDPLVVARLRAELANWAPANMDITANFAPIGTWTNNFNPGPAIQKRDVILQVQAALNRIGFDAGKPDGLIGPKTQKAIDAFEKALGMSQSGAVNARLLAVLGSQPV